MAESLLIESQIATAAKMSVNIPYPSVPINSVSCWTRMAYRADGMRSKTSCKIAQF